MTAPDPGLADLIATHTLRVVELNEVARYPECNGCDWVGGLVKDHAVHLASVVEQHTIGRMAALEVDSANWKGRYDATHEVLRACTETWTRTIRDRDHWQARAEKAAATIARVEKLAHDMRGWCSPHGISVTYSDRICAVLEGEWL